MRTVPQTRRGRNEGGRYSAKRGSAWYTAIEAQHIARTCAAEDRERTLTTALATQVGKAVTALPEAATRIAKAATLVQHKDVWPLSDGTFLVGSESDTDKAYLVQRGPWTCDCKAATYQPGPCKHVCAVWLTIKLGSTYAPSYT